MYNNGIFESYDAFKQTYINQKRKLTESMEKITSENSADEDLIESEAGPNVQGTFSKGQAPIPSLSKAPGKPRDINLKPSAKNLKGAIGKGVKQVEVVGPEKKAGNKGPVISTGKKLAEAIFSYKKALNESK